jgi:hypothetical protein
MVMEKMVITGEENQEDRHLRIWAILFRMTCAGPVEARPV